MGILPDTHRVVCTGGVNEMKSKFALALGFRPVYEDTAEEIAAKKTADDAKKAADEEARKKATSGSGGTEEEEAKRLGFNEDQQRFLNKRLADERRKNNEQSQKTIDELKKLKEAQGTTEKQKAELQVRIEELQRQHMSKEEIQKQEQEKQFKEYQQQIHAHKTEAETWQQRYQKSTIKRALQDEAVDAGAYSPAQIVDMLESKTRLVAETDDAGQTTGEFIPRIHLTEFNEKEGKTVTLDLTVKEALTKMKNTPEKYGNLFKATLSGGLGQNGNATGTGGRKGKHPKDMTPAEWAEARKKDPSLTFADQQ